MSRPRVLIVDDEPLAREVLRDLISADDEVEVIGECGDGASARRRILAERPDIVFLDIEMPALGGLDVASSLGAEPPVVIFVTAWDQHAPAAFDRAAIDFVLKPFSDERLQEALARAKRRVRESRIARLATELARPAPIPSRRTSSQPPNESSRRWLERFAVRIADRTVLLEAGEIRWIQSEDYCVRLHTTRGAFLHRASLGSFEEQLDPSRFLRVHRGAIVRIDAVREIRSLFRGVQELVLDEGTRLRISRARRRAVEEALGLGR